MLILSILLKVDPLTEDTPDIWAMAVVIFVLIIAATLPDAEKKQPGKK